MKRFAYFTLTMTLAAALMACSSANSDPNDTTDSPGLLSSARPAPPPKITIPAGTKIGVTMIDGVSTDRSSAGDQFTASLSQPIVIDGKTVLDTDTKVRGRITAVEDAGRVSGRASISMVLTEIIRDGESIEISTKPWAAQAEATKARDAGVIAGGAGVGALVGALAGGKKGAAIGAAVGGGAGTGTVLATKGKELNYPPESRLTFTLSSDTQI